MTAVARIAVPLPLTIRRAGGRKLAVTPEGCAPGVTPAPMRADLALIKVLARAHRWERLLKEGRHGSPSDLAAEKIDRSYLGKTLLAPDVSEGTPPG